MRKFRKIFRIAYPIFLLLNLAWLVWHNLNKGAGSSELFVWMLGLGLVVMAVDLFQRRDQLWPRKRQKGDLRDG